MIKLISIQWLIIIFKIVYQLTSYLGKQVFLPILVFEMGLYIRKVYAVIYQPGFSFYLFEF